MSAGRKGERRGLGRGLPDIMGDLGLNRAEQGDRPRDVQLLPIAELEPNPDQPRRAFDEEALEELASSIREKGILQPLIVRPNPHGRGWQIVAGERRWRAAQRVPLHEVPAIVRELGDTEVLEIAIVENIQRADLNPLEEAQAYRQLIDRFGHTQERLAEALGRSRSHIANLLRLLQLPEEVQELLREGALSAGHARALITAEDPAALAREVVRRGLSVRETERLAKARKAAREPARPERSTASGKDADTRALEADLSAQIGMKVSIEHDEKTGGGRLVIRYRDLEALDELCSLLTASREA